MHSASVKYLRAIIKRWKNQRIEILTSDDFLYSFVLTGRVIKNKAWPARRSGSDMLVGCRAMVAINLRRKKTSKHYKIRKAAIVHLSLRFICDNTRRLQQYLDVRR